MSHAQLLMLEGESALPGPHDTKMKELFPKGNCVCEQNDQVDAFGEDKMKG